MSYPTSANGIIVLLKRAQNIEIVRGFSLSIPPICRTPRVMAIPLLQEFQTLRQGM